MSSVSPKTRYKSVCKLCHRNVAEVDPLEVPLTGDPGKRVQKLMGILLKHLEKNHAEDLQRGSQVAGMIARELPAWMILHAFEHEDPSLEPRMETVRAAIFQEVRRNFFSDEALQATVNNMPRLDPETVLELVKTIRDACCELGRFAARAPEQGKIITLPPQSMVV